MDRVATLAPKERNELFSATAARKSMTPAIVEKDFWVCWTLGKLFQDAGLAPLLMFKGGTSLSKVFHLIERFSEDIDLILDWKELTEEDPEADRSRTRQQKLNDDIEARGQVYIAGELREKVSACITPVCQCDSDENDLHTLNVRYPAAFADEYLRPTVRLEIGPLASWLPSDTYSIRPYAAEVFPKVFEQAECTVHAIKVERTFWEKITILHQEAHRPKDKVQPKGYSRHYYDLAKMAASSVREKALADLDLLAQVVRFKQRFYPRAWARYELAAAGTLKLIPASHVMATLERDYRDMRPMIFGDYPDFAAIMARLKQLEDEINGRL